MEATFLGDSLTAGEGNDSRSFAHHFASVSNKQFENINILAVSGTTVGEYSVYPVDGDSLLSVLYRNKDVVRSSDVIVLEYGVNDVSSIFLGNVTLTQAVLAVVKALDLIKQVNPRAKIYWLKPVAGRDVIEFYAKNHVEYLYQDYLHNIRNVDENSILRWADTYERFYHFVSRLVTLVAGISDLDKLKSFIVSDNIHINDEAHKELARVLMEAIEADVEGNKNN